MKKAKSKNIKRDEFLKMVKLIKKTNEDFDSIKSTSSIISNFLEKRFINLSEKQFKKLFEKLLQQAGRIIISQKIFFWLDKDSQLQNEDRIEVVYYDLKTRTEIKKEMNEIADEADRMYEKIETDTVFGADDLSIYLPNYWLINESKMRSMYHQFISAITKIHSLDYVVKRYSIIRYFKFMIESYPEGFGEGGKYFYYNRLLRDGSEDFCRWKYLIPSFQTCTDPIERGIQIIMSFFVSHRIGHCSLIVSILFKELMKQKNVEVTIREGWYIVEKFTGRYYWIEHEGNIIDLAYLITDELREGQLVFKQIRSLIFPSHLQRNDNENEEERRNVRQSEEMYKQYCEGKLSTILENAPTHIQNFSHSILGIPSSLQEIVNTSSPLQETVSNQQHQIIENIIAVLIRIDREAKEEGISPENYCKCGSGITKLLEKVENDFGLDFMLAIFREASDRLGHTLGPMDSSTLKKLIKTGFIVTNVKRVAKYKKNQV